MSEMKFPDKFSKAEYYIIKTLLLILLIVAGAAVAGYAIKELIEFLSK